MAKIIKAQFEATIPTVMYGNVRPVLEVEGEDWVDVRDTGLTALKEISDSVADEKSRFEIRGVAKGRTVVAEANVPAPKTSKLTGVTVINPEEYLRGSKFHEQFYAEFDPEQALKAIVKAYPEVAGREKEITEMWSINGKASSMFGSAIHAALENWIRFNELGKGITKDRNKALSKNPLIAKIVMGITELLKDKDLRSEVFVADDKHKLSGTIDILEIVDLDKNIVRIQDFKTDADLFEKKYQKSDSPFKALDKKLGANRLTMHSFQLSFYAYILKQYGYTVEGLDIYWLNPETLKWEKHSREVIDVSEILDARKS